MGDGLAQGFSSREAQLRALFAQSGFPLADVPVLQPAEPFIELSGEDIRRRLFLTSDAAGHELCLRPEFTIPAARAYLAAPEAGQVVNAAFLGSVFRQRADSPSEFTQGSIESFGRTDLEAADAEIIALALAAENVLGGPAHRVRIGDMGLTAALIDGLELPPVVARRVRQNGELRTATAAASQGHGGLAAYQGVLNALRGTDPNEARAFVKDLLSIAGVKAVGGRTTSEIADRFLEKAEDESGGGISAEQIEILNRFKAISGDPDSVAHDVRTLSQMAGIDLEPALDSFETRNGFMAAQGIDLSRLEASTGFVRNLDYYSGFVFEFVREKGDRPAIAGGRYDGLLKRLGAKSNIPAVGCAIWLERFEAQA